MNGYDQQLKELLAQCARKKKLEASAAELRRQRDTYAARAEELKEAMREEQADVDRLEGRSLAAFFYNVVGKMDEKLTQERQEAYAARVRYDAAARELAGAEEDLARCQAELGTLDGCEEQYAALLREKTQAVKAAGGAAAEQILRMEEREAYLESQERELGEASAAGQSALATADGILESLSSAEGWGTWDLIGGGLIADLAKHSKLDEAQAADLLPQSGPLPLCLARLPDGTGRRDHQRRFPGQYRRLPPLCRLCVRRYLRRLGGAGPDQSGPGPGGGHPGADLRRPGPPGADDGPGRAGAGRTAAGDRGPGQQCAHVE